MTLRSILAASAASVALLGAASAQETTGAIRGTVTDEGGAPLGGASVVIRDAQTGQTRRVTTDDDGSFAARNLSVSGSYTVTATATGYQTEEARDLRVTLGNTQTLTFDLAGADAGAADEIVVVGTRQVIDVATGPSSVFGLETLQNAPTINRDIKDVLRLDPRIFVDPTNGDAIQCAGGNPRFNSLTVDGVRLNDNFGLNQNGYPTERIPFSFDAIEQVAVELAPFDVEYGQFTSCNVNAVTKSGSNEFHGGAFIDYTSDGLRGDRVGDRDVDLGDFDEVRYGINVGGPIIKDRLFFFGAYEKLEGANVFGDNTPTQRGITDAQFGEIVDVAASVYGYEVGPLPTSIDNEDEKFLGRLDLNITDGQRASFVYNYNDGFNISPSDGDPDELPEFNHFFERGAKLESYVGSLYSDWTDNFSTELRISYLDLDNRQESIGDDGGLGEVQITVDDTVVYLGGDDSRQSNDLNYDLFSFKLKGDYVLGDHTLTLGIEREEFEVFNLFVQETDGEFRFDSIDDFRAGDLERIIYENAAGSNDPNDAAAEFGYEITTIYAQDVWEPTANLAITAGLRFDHYTTDDSPAFNPGVAQRFGLRNDADLDGKGILQPRLAANRQANDALSLRAGVGLYSGGNPNVWLSNNYSNNGVTLFEFQRRGLNVFDDFTYAEGERALFDIPQEAVQAVADAEGGGPVNLLDPNFDIPSDWKFNLGATYFYDPGFALAGDGITVNADILYSKVRKAATVRSLDFLENDADGVTRTAPDGRPIYGPVFSDNFVLTNTDEKPEALTLSVSASASYDFGLDATLSYAYVDAEDVNPMTSSVAFSNFYNFTTADANDPEAATSDYEIAHRFTGTLSYGRDFVQDYETRFFLFGSLQQGSPFSYTYNQNQLFEGFSRNRRGLLYVPDGADDPLVTYADTLDRDGNVIQTAAEAQAGLLRLLNGDLEDYQGEIAPRNAFADDWYTRWDIRVSQEFPGLRANDRTEAFVVMENVGNFLNSRWGLIDQQGFPGNASVIDVDINDDGQYVYSNFAEDPSNVIVDASLWEVRFGLRYQF